MWQPSHALPLHKCRSFFSTNPVPGTCGRRACCLSPGIGAAVGRGEGRSGHRGKGGKGRDFMVVGVLQRSHPTAQLPLSSALTPLGS